MKKSNLLYRTCLRILAILFLLSSYLWIAPSRADASSAGFEEYSVLGKEEQTYMSGKGTADNPVVNYGHWTKGYGAGLLNPVQLAAEIYGKGDEDNEEIAASGQEQTQPQTFGLSLAEYLWSTDSLQTDDLSVSKGGVSQTHSESNPAAPLQQGEQTTLTVDIISSPWVVLDHNNPSGVGEQVPKVFVVEAVITNTGNTTATGVTVNLNYSEDVVNNWVLLGDEDPDRGGSSLILAPGAAYHAYWFARYSTVIGASHQYTVTANAHNAEAVATSDNFYGNPEAGKTVKTRAFQSTGNSGIVRTSADIVVGVAFTVTIEYDLGNSPQEAIFGPVGNTDFDPSAYRLLASEVRFYNDAQTQQSTVYDRLYFPTVPSFDGNIADKAEATFTFIALTASNTRLCTYTGLGYQSSDKYDKSYCEGDNIIPITGTLTLSLTKQVSDLTIQQNQPLTYTLHYTNNGSRPLTYVWVWDDVDLDIGSVISATIDPSSDPGETTDSRVAWDLGTVPESGQPGSTGTLAFTILVDGNEQDLADDTPAVNHAFFGVNQDSLPQKAALTSTVATAVEAPTISLSKTDGRATVEPGDALTYTLRITNSGSITATGLIITDVLPSYVTLAGPTSPVTDTQNGQTLVWTSLGDLAPGGGTVVIEIPVTVGSKVPNGIILVNDMAVKYSNPAGWVFATKLATDATVVNAPILSIGKSDYPDPVLAGGLITYTLQYANSGSAAATNVLITDVVPVSTTCQICSPSPCGMSNGVVSWTVGTVPSNTNDSVSFSVQVSDTLLTGEVIRNEDYGIVADQTNVVTGALETTQVNREAGFIEGYAFIDADGDGFYDDPGEDTLSGVAITLTGPTVQVTTTNSSGFYRFRVETEEPVSLSAALPDGYFRTTPGIIVFLESILGGTQPVDFGYAPITSTFGVIYGTVFEDADRDGSQDLGEDGLLGVMITSAEAVTSPVTTNDLGQYTFRYNTSGAVTITETNPDYYVSTTPDVVQTDVVTGSSNGSPIDFGDFLGIKITGQVFDDANVNGVNDDAGGVSGAIVAAGDDSFPTGSSGVYTLYVAVNDGNPITISETDPAGYLSTNAIPGAGMGKVDANTLRITSPTSGTVYSDGDFGDVQAGNVITISGQVWNDNGAGGGNLANGLRDGTEPGLTGAIVSLSSGLTQTTASDGLFLLYAPPNQVITVTEANPSGYASTNAVPGNDASKVDNDTLRVSPLVSGSTSADNLFGDVLASSAAIITGTVFDDENENGVFDGSETGISGVTVTMEISGGNTITVPTDSAGNCQFAVAPGAELRLTSAGPGGSYDPTTPESVILQPLTAGVYPDNNFGYSDDTDVAVIYGLVFDDVDSDGERDFGEPGLAGAVITLTLNSSPISTTTTSGNGLITGTFRFTVTQAGIYGVSEENPPGYRSTTRDEVNVGVSLGNSYPVEFGDTNNPNTASIYGTAFHDIDGDGEQDGDETGLAGVVISVTVGGGTGVLTTTTKPYGLYNYGFDIEEQGYHTVSEQDLTADGFHSTTPDEVNIYVELGESYPVNFGDTDAVYTIMGTVFDDDSGDGVQDPGELGIAGVLISLSNGMTTTTDSNGGYTFALTETGFVQVIETDPTGYHSTTPNTVTVNVTDIDEAYTVDFGDRANSVSGSSFFGTVFNDQNANGARDGTELGLSGVTVTISTIGGTPSPSTMATNEWGQYTFLIENAGTHTVTESDLPGYLSTCAIPGDPAVTKVDNNTLRAAFSSITPGTDLGDNLFGDALTSLVPTTTLSISKDAEDMNGWPLVVSDTIRYTWQVTNTGTYTAYNVTVTDDLPDGVTFEERAADLGSATGSDPVVWTISELATDTVATLWITVTINGDQAGQTITNTGSVTSSNVTDPPDDPPPVCPDGSEPDGNGLCLTTPVLTTTLSISKDAEDVNGWPLVVSDTIRYTWRVTNTGTYTAYNVTLTDDLPDGVAYVDASADRGTPTGTDPVIWTIPTLPDTGNNVATLWITVTINADQAGQTITNTGSVTGSNVPDPPPPPPEVCPDGSEPVGGVCLEPPVPTTTLSISKSAEDVDGSPLVVSDTIRYTWQVTNTGTYTAYNVTLTDNLPDGVSYVDASADRGTPTGTDPVIWTIPTLPDTNNNVATLWITVTINADQAGQTITNTGSVTSSNVFDPPDDPPPVCPDGSTPGPGGECDVKPLPVVAFATASQSGTEDVGTMTIIAQLNAASSLDVTIPFTVTGTATEGVGQDYTITSSPVTITAGNLTTTIAINVNDDGLSEPNETVIVTMGTPTNATKGTPAVHTATINDDDIGSLTVDFSSDNYSAGEGVGTAVITVTLDAVSALTVTVDYATSDGTATTADNDYLAASGTLTFTPGITSQTFTVAITDDAREEGNETVTLTLSDPTNANLDLSPNATLAIVDDDYNIYLPIIVKNY